MLEKKKTKTKTHVGMFKRFIIIIIIADLRMFTIQQWKYKFVTVKKL